MSSIVRAKAMLRKNVQQRLMQISKESMQEKSVKIAANLLSLPQVQQCCSASVYLNLPTGEVRQLKQYILLI